MEQLDMTDNEGIMICEDNRYELILAEQLFGYSRLSNLLLNGGERGNNTALMRCYSILPS